MCTIVEIPAKACNTPNAPGLVDLYAIPTADLDTEISATAGVVAAFDIATAKKFFKINFTDASGDMQAIFNGETRDSEFWSGGFTAFVSQIKATLNVAIEAYAGVPLCLVGVDSNGTKHVMGDKAHPAFMTRAEGGTGLKEEGARNGYTLTFSLPLSNHGSYTFSGDIATITTAAV